MTGRSKAKAVKLKQANARAAARRASSPTAVAARYDRRLGRVVVRLSSGIDVAFAPQDAQGLEWATPADLARIEISPSGLGLNFPTLDADLYVPALLEGVLGSRSWMVARLGVRGGDVRSAAKAESSRANGRLGGRPRKATTVQ